MGRMWIRSYAALSRLPPHSGRYTFSFISAVNRRVHLKNSEFSAFGCPVSLNSELSTLSLAFSQSFRLSEFSRWRERSFGGSALQGRRPFNDRFRPSACFNDYGGMSCGPPYGNLARTHARTHTTACRLSQSPKFHAAGAFSHEPPAERGKTRTDAACGTSPSCGIMRTLCDGRWSH